MVLHPEAPEKAGAANDIASLQEDLYYGVWWHNASLLGGASWARFLALSSSASGAGSYAERWCLCTTFRYGIKLVQGSPACTFSHKISFLFHQKKSSPAHAEAAALRCVTYSAGVLGFTVLFFWWLIWTDQWRKLFLPLGDQEVPSQEPHFAMGGNSVEKRMLLKIAMCGFIWCLWFISLYFQLENELLLTLPTHQ